jgi:hypothetical protein
MIKTTEQIEDIKARRAEARRWLENAAQVFKETECSLGAGIIGDAINEIRAGGMEEY